MNLRTIERRVIPHGDEWLLIDDETGYAIGNADERLVSARKYREALAALRAVFEPPEVGRCPHGYSDSSRSVTGYREAKQWYMENRDGRSKTTRFGPEK